MGWKDVVLLERDRLTSGTTWHAAGLMVTFGSTSETSTEMRKYTRDLYAGSRPRRARRPASSRSASSRSPPTRPARGVPPGLGVQPPLRRRRARDLAARGRELFPLARTDDILAGFYVKEDGRVNPVDVTMALAKGARLQGATILEGVPVTGVTKRRGAVTGVARPTATIEASTSSTAPACGRRQLGERNGVNIPLQAAEHYYLITEADPRHLEPAGRCSRTRLLRLLPRGGRRPDGRPVRAGLRAVEGRGHPEDFSFGEIAPTGTAWARTSRRR
jgi:glycine/D-amino acid oxidase-like deaminating enzyme